MVTFAVLPHNLALPTSCPYRNLQAAVGAYYDFYGPVTMPAISAKDVTLCPGQKVPPNTALRKVWKVSNTGTPLLPGQRQILIPFLCVIGADTWQNGTSLTLQTRNTLCGPARVLLPALRPGQEAEVQYST